MNESAPFLVFLRRGLEAGGFGTDDILAAMLPLLDQVAVAHQNGQVAPLDGLDGIRVEEGRLSLDDGRLRAPRKNIGRIATLQRPASAAVEVVGDTRQTTDLDAGAMERQDLRIAAPGAEITRPVYLPGYVTWEHRCGHHDQLSDVFSLGLLLASLACGVDFTDPEDLELFVSRRDNLFALNSKLHPVVAAMVLQTTELNRHRRVQTVEAVAQRLRGYRDQSADYAVDFARLPGFHENTPTGRAKLILAHLRNRLFEISRRNRLIHFRPTLQTLNLTLASVPLMLDHRNIKPEQLFLWHERLAKALAHGESVVLGQYVRFEDAPYASGVLDQIIATERRDRAEFGFAQLRLVICFLRWHNLKETPEERIHSPLLLQPVELTRRKGVRDAYVLKPLTTEAEVNPALRHHLRQLYGLDLPERVDLAATTVDAFHQLLVEQIRASEPGVTLTKQDRPQIELIHERARQRLDQFRRRQRISRPGIRRFDSFDYSYDRERFRPLGVQLFHHRIKPSRLPFAKATDNGADPRLLNIVDPEPSAHGDSQPCMSAQPGVVIEQQVYALRGPQGGGNPYQWDFDLCSLTLGNFNYRKMSLVQDYAALLEREVPGTAFEAIFSLQPRPPQAEPPTVPLAEHYAVVECDPTQTKAVAQARDGGSYIIQGPPGTGKSQTITNLIADFVARGKRVLFVCEKRAAIDVVFHRLGRQGLDELCCLIHDSQTDKRDFVRNLKQTYENFLNQPIDETIELRRAEVVRQIELELAALRRWTSALEAKVAGCSLTMRDLLARLVELRAHAVTLDPVAAEQVPPYALWSPHGEVVRALSAALRRAGGTAVLAQHSFRHLTERALSSPQPLATITAAVDESETLLARIAAVIDGLDAAVVERILARSPGDATAPASGESGENRIVRGNGDSVAQSTGANGAMDVHVGDIEAIVALAAELEPIAAADALDLLDPRASRTKKAAKAVREWRAAQDARAKAHAANAGWRDPLPPADTTAALELARKLEPSAWRWLAPAFWRLRRVLHTRYDFSSQAVPRTWVQVLTELQVEQAAVEAVSAARRTAGEMFGELDCDVGIALIEQTSGQTTSLPAAARRLHDYLVENPEAAYLVADLAALQPVMMRLREALGLVIEGYAGLTRADLVCELQRLKKDLVWLPDVLPLLVDALNLPRELRHAMQRLPLSDQQLESAMARKSLAASYRADRTFEATDGRMIAMRVARLEAGYKEWLGLNARWIHQRVRREFRRKVQLSTTPAAQLTEDEKEFKQLYATGRRELEHEFSKTMRHRSIRDLADDETGVVLRDLKPVWLMSPLSISDTLPLSVDAFDVVIFDEASQIPVEEAIPAVYRANQAIVVGDEMQLPPTNFFSATRLDDEPLVDDDGEGAVAEDLDADSFLTQAARNLPSTMLGWHYRSRYEALISFSNHAFYEARLLTIPDRQLQGRTGTELPVRAATDAIPNVDALLARSVSFHFHPEAVYEQRKNAAEADYIAHLVRGLLARETRHSIGIVAFSEAQQGEIERALDRLGSEDASFRNRLETEYEREEDGQFCGLFVKNLENVQGDERDIVILSICYGYDRNRRMLMNFGPINQRGGEKRLNVIFSRARLHMAVVSSIRHFDITNDYNDGANCLRNFLEYAAACSSGDGATARRVLDAANPAGRPFGEAARPMDATAAEIAAALREQGMNVDCDVGQSSFRLPLAVRRPGDDAHALGVLIDNAEHYAQRDILERYLLRPGVLRAFGWRTVQVFTKDWYHDRGAVLKRIEAAIDGEELTDPGALRPTAGSDEAAAAESDPTAEATPRTVENPTAGDEPAPPASKSNLSSVHRPAADSRSGDAGGSLGSPTGEEDPDSEKEAPRRFTFTEEGSSKFWEVSINGTALVVHFGRIGTKGQTQTKLFATADAVRRERDKLIRSKLAKGYVAAS